MNAENRRANARDEAERGSESIRAAEALLGIDLPNDAVSRAYYAAFHYARALLYLDGLQPKTHRGVAALLTEHFEAKGRLSADAVSALARLQTFRDLADYGSRTRLPDQRARDEVAAARRFIDEARAVLAAAGVS
jgi:uncharacterized protein (UPF0332 family)